MKYYLIVGEASGDLHASHLMKALKEQDKDAEFRFFGGDNMTAEGGERVRHYKDLAYMGLIPVLLHLPTIFRNMAMWRFEAAAWLCVIAISGIYVGAMELVNISREAEVTGNKTSHYMGKMFRVGIMALVVLYLGRALLNCLFPMVYRLVYKSSNDEVLAAQITNGAADRIRLPVVLAILVMDLFPSVVCYYMVLQKRISVPVYGVIFTPLSMMVIGYCIRLIPTQFTADFTAAFEPFGWLLMMYGAYMHTRSRVSSIPQ